LSRTAQHVDAALCDNNHVKSGPADRGARRMNQWATCCNRGT
jgi:hypothetical protein